MRVENGQLFVVVKGSGGTTVTVQATEDFVTWTDVKTISIDSFGVGFGAVEPIAAGATGRFYRIKQGP